MSLELGKKVVVIFPTKRIARVIEAKIPELLPKQQPKIAVIWPNSGLCAKLGPIPHLKFQFKKNCSICEHLDKPEKCKFQNLLLNDFDVYCLTYDKLRALLASPSPESEKLLKKLLDCDVFIFDEFTKAVIGNVPTIDVVASIDEGNKQKRKRMSEYLRSTFPEYSESLDGVLSELWTTIMKFLTQFENVKRSGVYKNNVIVQLSEDERKSLFYNGWRKITQLTWNQKNTTKLQNVFLALLAKEIVVSCENGTVRVTPRLKDALNYIRKFCSTIGGEKAIFVVDSYQPQVDFIEVFSRITNHELWGPEGDPLRTNYQQLIISDRAHWGAWNFFRDKMLQMKTKSFIKSVLEDFLPSQIMVVTTNRKMADIVSQWNPPKDLRVTWFRSDWMRGVPVEGRRIMICVGGPYIPRKAYDASAKSFRIESFAKDLELLDDDARTLEISRLLRLDDTKSEFINSIGRVKDPEGKERSVVFTLGMQKYEVDILLKQDAPVSKPNLIRPFRKGGMLRDGVWIAKLWLDRFYYCYPYINVKDLPLIARIIRCTRNKAHIRASEIVPGITDVIVEKAKQYEDILHVYNVKIVEKRGGVSFCWVNMSLDHFSHRWST